MVRRKGTSHPCDNRVRRKEGEGKDSSGRRKRASHTCDNEVKGEDYGGQERSALVKKKTKFSSYCI